MKMRNASSTGLTDKNASSEKQTIMLGLYVGMACKSLVKQDEAEHFRPSKNTCVVIAHSFVGYAR